MTIKIKINKKEGVPSFNSTDYPKSGLYQYDSDSLNYYAVSLQYNIVSVVYIDSLGSSTIWKEEKVDDEPKKSTVTVDEMIRVIAVSKDARHIKEVLK